MAGKIKGITVEIGGDTTKLGKALEEVNSKSKSLQSELKGVNSLLKMDPTNVTLLKQKQDILNESIETTKEKLNTLKDAQEQVQAQFDKGEITEEQYRDFQREIEATEQKLKSLTEQLKDFGSVGAQQVAAVGEKMKDTGDKISDAGKKLMPVTATVTAVGTASVKTAADFEASMSQVAATMGMTAEEINAGSEEYNKLEQAARDMGASTKYSASEAAEALNYLALAGYDVDKSVETLPTVLNLAASGNMDLATASDMVTDAMSALGDSAGTADNFVDKMAKTSQKSNTSVEQLGEAILTVGGTAKTLAGGTTELNTALGILADNGIKGSEGGTKLRNVILSLSAPTDAASAAMEELGLQAYDADGNMRPLNDIFNDLNGILSTMSSGEQTEVLNTIFNKTDLAAANALLANSGERFDELSGYIDNADGAAQTMADTMQNNLSGQITTLKSALSEAAISIGQALLPIIKDLVSFIQNLIDKFNGLSDSTKTTIVVIGGILAAIGPLLIIIGKVVGSIGTILTYAPQIVSAIGTMKGAVGTIVSVLKGALMGAISGIKTAISGLFSLIMAHPVIAIVTAIVAIIIVLYNKCEWFRNGVNAILSGISKTLTKAVNTVVKFFSQTIPDAFNTSINWLKKLPGKIWDAIVGAIDKVSKWGTNMRSKAVSGMKNVVSGIINTFANIPSKMASIGKNLVQGLWNGINNAKDWILEKVKGFGSSVLGGIKSFFGIKSPSTVFRDQIGKYLAEGIGVGFTGEMDNISEDMKNAIPTSFDFKTRISNSVKNNGLNADDIKSADIKHDVIVSALKEALKEVNIVLDDEKVGRFIDDRVEGVVYS